MSAVVKAWPRPPPVNPGILACLVLYADNQLILRDGSTQDRQHVELGLARPSDREGHGEREKVTRATRRQEELEQLALASGGIAGPGSLGEPAQEESVA